MAGYNVIYDVQYNFRTDRTRGEKRAEKCGATPVLVWVKTPYDIAFKRGVEREEAPDQRRKTEEQMHESLKFHMGNLEAPGPEEKVIVIDGTLSFEEQYKSFTEQLEQILHNI